MELFVVENSCRLIGIIMLDTRFPRVLGDIGNPATWGFPVLYEIVAGASPERVVTQGAPGLLQPFVDAAQKLEGHGAQAIITTCGFLTLQQEALSKAVSVPVMTSSLFQVSSVAENLPAGSRPAILTIEPASLTQEHLAAANVPADTPIGGTKADSHFNRTILSNLPELDMEQARQNNVDAALRLVEAHENVAAIVLECTNMAPYADDISIATGLPVWSMNTAVNALVQDIDAAEASVK